MFKLLIWIILPFYKLLYLPKVKGKENLPKNCGFVVVCNHFAKVDAFMMVDLFKNSGSSIGKTIEKYKNGKMTLEQVLTDKGGDI